VRLFWRRLEARSLHRAGESWRVAASVHYEVEHASPRHADVRCCPRCGRTGGYAEAGHLVEAVHDPLGLEALLFGTVRGAKLAIGARELEGLAVRLGLGEATLRLCRPFRADMNTGAVAVAYVR
jgi:hypothetical protein